jgi:hypothetical protein
MVAKLGNFLVDIDTTVNEKGIISLTKSLGKLTVKSAKFGAALTGAVVGAGVGFTKLVKNTVDETAELGRLADDLGVTTNFLETFIRSFETVGAGGDEAINTIRSLKKEIEAFKLGRGNIEAFGILGINPQALGADVGKNFDIIRNRFNALTDAQRLYFVDQIGLGEKSLRVLRLTDQEYSNLQKTSREFPLATKEQINSSEEFFRSFKRTGQAFTSFKRSLILDVTPAFTNFTNELIKLLGDPVFKDNISGLFDKLFDETLPKLVEATPIIVDSLGKMAGSVSDLATGLNDLANNPFIQGIAKVGSAIGGAYVSAFKGLGTGIAGVISSIEDRKALPLRDPNDIRSGFRFQPTPEEIEDNVRRIRGINSSTNQQIISGGNNTYNINMPIQRLGDDATQEDRLLLKMEDALDRREQNNNKVASENFKSGAIQP